MSLRLRLFIINRDISQLYSINAIINIFVYFFDFQIFMSKIKRTLLVNLFIIVSIILNLFFDKESSIIQFITMI